MKTHALIWFVLSCLVLLPAVSIFAEEADIVYVEGFVDVKYQSGDREEAFIGDFIETGDTLITGDDGLAELEQATGAIIKISADTIFTFQEVEINGEKRGVLSAALGAVRYKVDRFTSGEPLIATPSMVAGVRGTEVAVFAGSDGSTLIIVDSGLVAVESQGKTVELRPEEGVEVRAGEAPGEKFKVLRGKIDYSTWNAEKRNAVRDDPVAAIRRIEKGILALRDKIAELQPLFEANRIRLDEETETLNKLKEDDKKEEVKSRYEQIVFPLEIETSYMALNLRYYALSALSFRRYVLGNMYIDVKTAYVSRPDSLELKAFLGVYENILDGFERDVVPLLVNADI